MPEQSQLILVDQWLDWLRHNLGRSAGTADSYRGHVLRLADWLESSGKNLLAAKPAELEEYAGRYLHQSGVRPISRRVPVAAIRGFYDWLYVHRLVAENPARSLPAPKAGRPMPKTMPLDCAEKLLMQPGLETFIACRDTAMLAVLIATGCRVSGLVALNEEDLIWAQSETGTERLIIRFTEKGKKERLVPVWFEAALLVRAYLGHPDLDRIDRTLPNGRHVFFINVRNRLVPAHEHYGEMRRLDRGSIRKMILRYGAKAGINRELLHPHAIRHLYGTELAESDVDLAQRQALLGHSKPETTAIYSHLAMRKLIETVDKSNPLGKMRSTPARALASRLSNRPRSQNPYTGT